MDMMTRGSHASICRLVKRSGATSVLEIGVGDGKRALAVTKALADANQETTVRYAAIDMFEMADGPITLRDFNQLLRTQGVQATLVPMEITPGIARVSSTIGVVDLGFDRRCQHGRRYDDIACFPEDGCRDTSTAVFQAGG